MRKERHTRVIDGKRHIWNTQRLIDLSKGLPITEVSLSAIPDLDYDCWFDGQSPSMKEVAGHFKRIVDADLKYPVILNESGQLMNGGHRCCKALVNGEKTIRAVQFLKTPEPDLIEPLVTNIDKTHVILYVRDQKKARAFYESVLELSPKLDVVGMTEFQISRETVLGLMPESGIKDLLGPKLPDPENATGVPRAELYLLVEDPEKLHSR